MITEPEELYNDLAIALETTPTVTRPLGAALLDDEQGGLGEFKEVCWQYLHKLPLGFQLGQLSCSDEPLNGHKNYEFDSRLFLNGDVMGQVMVALYRPTGADPNEVYLELEQGQIWYHDWRGQGMGRAIFQAVVELGRALGVRGITAFAMYDGRFVWPCLGFKFGDYHPEEDKAQKYRRAFREFCLRNGITPPSTQELKTWSAQDFARFDPGILLPARIGHKHDKRPQMVTAGRAFMLSRRPFFLCYPLEQQC